MRNNSMINCLLGVGLLTLCISGLSSCKGKGSIKNYEPIAGLTAFGVGGSTSYEASTLNRHNGLLPKEKMRAPANLSLYCQFNGSEISKFNIGLDNPDDYRLLNLLETDEFIELIVGLKKGLSPFSFDSWYNTSPRNGTGLINTYDRDLRYFIIEKKTHKVAELVAEKCLYFPKAASISHNGALYSVINSPVHYGDTMLAKYYFGENGLEIKTVVLEEECNPDSVGLFKDNEGNLYFQNQQISITKFNDQLEILSTLQTNGVVIDSLINVDVNIMFIHYYLSPTYQLYAEKDNDFFDNHGNENFKIEDEGGEAYDLREFRFFYPGNRRYGAGPSVLNTACKMYEDEEAIYYNYGKLANDLKDLTDEFVYAKYYKEDRKSVV